MKPNVISLHLCATHNDYAYDTVRVMVFSEYSQTIGRYSSEQVMPSMTLDEALTFVKLIDSRHYHIEINGEGMPKRAAFFKLENARIKLAKQLREMIR